MKVTENIQFGEKIKTLFRVNQNHVVGKLYEDLRRMIIKQLLKFLYKYSL